MAQKLYSPLWFCSSIWQRDWLTLDSILTLLTRFIQVWREKNIDQQISRDDLPIEVRHCYVWTYHIVVSILVESINDYNKCFDIPDSAYTDRQVISEITFKA